MDRWAPEVCPDLLDLLDAEGGEESEALLDPRDPWESLDRREEEVKPTDIEFKGLS